MSNNEKIYWPVVAELLNTFKPSTILDAPAGRGWIKELLDYGAQIDGIDLYEGQPTGYRELRVHDLDRGIPCDLPVYDAIVCCEGIEHLANPGLLLASAYEHLAHGGLIVITTPNTWFPCAKLQFLARGFFPSFPCLAGRIKRGTHMHIMPWSYPQLHLFLHLFGFIEIRLHNVSERKPKHLYEWLIGYPQRLYCAHKSRTALSVEEKEFWKYVASYQSLYGRRLVVSARKPSQ
jgi:SAM-dependent methyltransferase